MLKESYKGVRDTEWSQSTMVCSHLLTLSMAFCFITGLTLAVSYAEEIENDRGPVVSDAVPNSLAQHRSLLAKHFVLLGKWKVLSNKSLKHYLKSFMRREYFSGRWG